LNEDELKTALRALAEEEAKNFARQRLQQAVRGRDLDELRDAIDNGVQAGLTDDELAAARRVLSEEQCKEEARLALKDALAGDHLEALRSAFQKGESVGLRGTEMEEARRRLEDEERKAVAREDLQNAIASGNAEQLRKAIEQGENAGLDEDELDAARQALAKAELQDSARQRLRDATANEELEVLRAAIDDGEQAGLSDEELEEARRTLADQEQKTQLLATLQRATSGDAALQSTSKTDSTPEVIGDTIKLDETQPKPIEEESLGDTGKSTTSTVHHQHHHEHHHRHDHYHHNASPNSTNATSDTRAKEKSEFMFKKAELEDNLSDSEIIAALKQRLRKIHTSPAEALAMCMQVPAIATSGNAGSLNFPLVDRGVLGAFAEQLQYILSPNRAETFLRNSNLSSGGNGEPVLEVPKFLGLFDGNTATGNGAGTRATTSSMPITDQAGTSNSFGSADDTPPSRSLPKEQQRRHLQQQKKPSERLRQLVLEQRVNQLTNREYQLVTQLREALFERHKSMKKMFEKVDLNEDTIVTLEEFLYALEGAGEASGHEIDRAKAYLSEEEAARILSFFDRDGQGVLRYNEFMRLLQGTIDIPGPPEVQEQRFGGARVHELGDTGRSSHGLGSTGRSSPGFGSTGRLSPGSASADMRDTKMVRERLGLGRGGDDVRRVQDAFRQWDTNGDGLITEREMRSVLQSLDPKLATRDVQRLMRAADSNGDGVIDHQEFVAWLFR